MLPLRRKAPSKVNLHLEVKGRRDDGYHDIETLFLPMDDPSDEIMIEDAGRPGIFVESQCPSVPSGMGNLCGKAAEAYFDESGLEPAINIKIDKRIPVAAGMGGGSSDAAATLLLLQDAYGALDEGRLRDIALSLGADVPFFLDPRPSLGRGVGESLETLDGFPFDIPILIAAPLFPVSAAWAYRSIDWDAVKSDTRNVRGLLDALLVRDFSAAGSLLRNDLSHSVMRKFPLLRILRDKLLSLGACGVQVSGSGPTLFAIFRDVACLEDARSGLRKAMSDASIPQLAVR